jgi:pilus assembly protein CpaC
MRSTNFQQDRTELVFVVTPRLVKPLPANYPLPTDTFGPTTPGEVYLNGNMEGHPARPAPAAMPAPAAAPAAAPMTAPSAAPTTSVPAPTAAGAAGE